MVAIAMSMLFLAALQLSSPPKNVLFVICDDMRPDLSPYGQAHARTPALEAFSKRARQSVLISDFPGT